MELSEGQINKFAELERCYSQYFYGSVVPVMEQVRKDINDKQLKELKDYSNSFAGMMSMAASNPIGGGSRASIDDCTNRYLEPDEYGRVHLYVS